MMHEMLLVPQVSRNSTNKLCNFAKLWSGLEWDIFDHIHIRIVDGSTSNPQ